MAPKHIYCLDALFAQLLIQRKSATDVPRSSASITKPGRKNRKSETPVCHLLMQAITIFGMNLRQQNQFILFCDLFSLSRYSQVPGLLKKLVMPGCL